MNIVQESKDIRSRLETLGLNLEALKQAALEAVTAKHSTVPNHPRNAPGTYAYHEGVRAMRDALCVDGVWVQDCLNGVETVLNKENRTRLAYQNADYCCQDDNPPQPISKKGQAVKNAVNSNQGQLFDLDKLDVANKEYSIWYLFVSESDGVVNAELSLPTNVEKGIFVDFFERIYVLENHELDVIDINDDEDENSAYDDEVEIKLKNSDV